MPAIKSRGGRFEKLEKLEEGVLEEGEEEGEEPKDIAEGHAVAEGETSARWEGVREGQAAPLGSGSTSRAATRKTLLKAHFEKLESAEGDGVTTVTVHAEEPEDDVADEGQASSAHGSGVPPREGGEQRDEGAAPLESAEPATAAMAAAACSSPELDALPATWCAPTWCTPTSPATPSCGADAAAAPPVSSARPGPSSLQPCVLCAVCVALIPLAFVSSRDASGPTFGLLQSSTGEAMPPLPADPPAQAPQETLPAATATRTLSRLSDRFSSSEGLVIRTLFSRFVSGLMADRWAHELTTSATVSATGPHAEHNTHNRACTFPRCTADSVHTACVSQVSASLLRHDLPLAVALRSDPRYQVTGATTTSTTSPHHRAEPLPTSRSITTL